MLVHVVIDVLAINIKLGVVIELVYGTESAVMHASHIVELKWVSVSPIHLTLGSPAVMTEQHIGGVFEDVLTTFVLIQVPRCASLFKQMAIFTSLDREDASGVRATNGVQFQQTTKSLLTLEADLTGNTYDSANDATLRTGKPILKIIFW